MKTYWILTDPEGTPLRDTSDRLYVYHDNGAREVHFAHAVKHVELNMEGTDAHMNEAVLVDPPALANLLAAIDTVLLDAHLNGLDVHHEPTDALKIALRDFKAVE